MNKTPEILYFVDCFSIFRRSIVISGWTFCPSASISEMILKFPSGRSYLLETPNISSRDVAAVHGRAASYCRFDEQILVLESHDDIIKAELIIRTSNGASQVVNLISNFVKLKDPTVPILEEFQETLKGHKQNGQFLEVGSRARSGIVRRNLAPDNWTYTGLDVMAGENVDVVGDAHRLSKLFPTKKFDAVTAFSVLEHMLMPWKFIVELNNVLNVGAVGYFTTHQSWPIHDAPWDFWRFSDKAWSALFNRATGFEIVTAAMGKPAYTVSSFCQPVTHFGSQPSYLSSSVLFRKISDTKLDWPVEVDEIINSQYPPGQLPIQSSKAGLQSASKLDDILNSIKA